VGGDRDPQRQATAVLDEPAVRRPRAARRRPHRGRGLGTWLSGYSAPVISVVAIVACAALVAAGLGVNHVLTARPAADATANPNCTLIVPASPLTAQGLATPYQLTATDPGAGPCDESNNNQTAFVQGAVLNPATGQVSIYDPLVVNAGTQPAAAPVVPALPAGAVVAVWFGYNGTTLTLAGADQNLTTGTGATATPTGAETQATATTPPSGTGSAAATTGTATAGATPATSGASVQSVDSVPLPPDPAGSGGWLNASLSGTGTGTGTTGTTAPASTAAATTAAATTATATPTGAIATQATTAGAPPTASASAAITPAAPAAGGTQTGPAANPGDSPAASGTQDAILQQANCVAGEDINGDFSSFTQVGACNAGAFFSAANSAIAAGKLQVPAPGIAKDGEACLTTRSFALIDQDQSDNVTTEYLTANGQTAQDTAANRNTLAGAATLFNGSDNGLLDLFVDPAIGCSPWEVPNLADGGAPAPGLPLDELQAAAWAGRPGSGPAALVPLNDPMTLDINGNFSTDKTNTYRSLVDMQALPAGESPAAYCSDMEWIQGSRLQQDFNLLADGPSPVPAAASNLFTFLAMRLQQSFMNLNCGSFGMTNDVSTTADGNGVVVAACFVNQVQAITSGPGNPTAGQTQCPATTGGPGDGQGNGQGTGQGTGQPSGSPSAPPSPYGMSHQGVRNYWHHHHHG
jgi:hypothetical protein